VRKDSLYCDAPASLKRRAVRTVMDTLFHALVRWLSPVLVFTAEEAWAARFPDAGSVHLLDWPQIDEREAWQGGWLDVRLGDKYSALRDDLRAHVLDAIEQLRRDKVVGSGLEACIHIETKDPMLSDHAGSVDMAELCIAGGVIVTGFTDDNLSETVRIVSAARTEHEKCVRCWRHLAEVGALPDPNLCQRCHDVVHADAAGPAPRTATPTLQPAPAQ